MDEKYISVTKFKESLAKLKVEGGTEATRATIARTLGKVVPQLLDDEPSADVQSVKHGRWAYPYKDKDINQCSECRSCVQDKISNVCEMFAYCPFCGARMDGDTE